MGTEIVAIEGIADACKMLDSVSMIVATRGYLNGLEAAADVVENALWPRVPVDLKAAMGKAHGGHGALVSRLDRWINVDARGRGGTFDIGFGNLGHIALWVEYGHRMVTRRSIDKTRQHKKLKWKMIRGGGVEVGDVPAHPFMRPAFESSKKAAVDAFVDAVTTSLTEAQSKVA